MNFEDIQSVNDERLLSAGQVINVNPGREACIITCQMKEISITAEADCCSVSWFEYPNSMIMPFKQISNIVRGDDVVMPYSGVQEFDKNTEYRIMFIDGSHVSIILRNSSNGYYNGNIGLGFKDIIMGG